ncbi:hypothetical protein GE061_012801 [Apolygus lucorum]|uniref:Uncharacterized protein n=1 Tax=Apolygus lucorum TaxID=248454 RepID=A0A8S9XUN6_APOLU|nr:hypothetical protein GE061_012801 [Apolygus lucorum]
MSLNTGSYAKRERDREENGDQQREAKRIPVKETTVEELLNRFGTMIDSKLASIKENMQNLATKEDILTIQAEINVLRIENEKNKIEIQNLKQEAKARDHKICILENEVRKNNIVLGGLATKSDRNLKTQVHEFFNDTLGFENGKPNIVAVRTLGKEGSTNNNNILVTLNSLEDKDAIFARAPALRNTGFWVSPDYTWEVRERRRRLQIIKKIIMRAQGHNQSVRVVFDKLRVGHEEFTWDIQKELLHRQGCGWTKLRQLTGVHVEEEFRRWEPRRERGQGTEAANVVQGGIQEYNDA